MQEAKDDHPLALYESQPPQWLPLTHETADLGRSNVAAIEIQAYIVFRIPWVLSTSPWSG